MNLLNNAIFKVPMPFNEPVYEYAPGSAERAKLKAALDDIAGKEIEIPLIIAGKEVRTGHMGEVVMPPIEVNGQTETAIPAQLKLTRYERNLYIRATTSDGANHHYFFPLY